MNAVLALDTLEKKTGRTLWEPALEADGTVREKAYVAEITGLLGDLASWPTGHRVFVRREPLHPRYAKDASAYENEHGVRLTAFATNTPGRQPAWMDLRHRAHARVEMREARCSHVLCRGSSLSPPSWSASGVGVCWL